MSLLLSSNVGNFVLFCRLFDDKCMPFHNQANTAIKYVGSPAATCKSHHGPTTTNCCPPCCLHNESVYILIKRLATAYCQSVYMCICRSAIPVKQTWLVNGRWAHFDCSLSSLLRPLVISAPVCLHFAFIPNVCLLQQMYIENLIIQANIWWWMCCSLASSCAAV